MFYIVHWHESYLSKDRKICFLCLSPGPTPAIRTFSNPVRLILLLEISTKPSQNSSMDRLFWLSLRMSFAIRFYRYLCPQRLSWNWTWRRQQTLPKESTGHCSSSRKLWQRTWYIHYFQGQNDFAILVAGSLQCSEQCTVTVDHFPYHWVHITVMTE